MMEVLSMAMLSVVYNEMLKHNTLPVFTWQVKDSSSPGRKAARVLVEHGLDGNLRPMRFCVGEESAASVKPGMNVQDAKSRKIASGQGKYYTGYVGSNPIELHLRSCISSVNWEGEYAATPFKTQVAVLFDNLPEGMVCPISVYTAGKKLKIDELIDVRKSSNQEAGIQGIRYVCRCGSRLMQLFLDGLFWVIAAPELAFVLETEGIPLK